MVTGFRVRRRRGAGGEAAAEADAVVQAKILSGQH